MTTREAGSTRDETAHRVSRRHLSLWLLFAFGVAIAAGLLEAAWTGVGRTAPTNTWLGVFALFVIFAVVTFPRVWWIPGLAILEEFTHLAVGYGQLPAWSRVVAHWSVQFVGVNLYPWVTFPLLALLGEVLYRRFRPSRPLEAWKVLVPVERS